jgi:hypothetical protein
VTAAVRDDPQDTFEQSWDAQQFPTPAELHLTWPVTVLLCALAGLVFGLLVLGGEQLVCRVDRAAYGQGMHSYCTDQVQR